MSDAVHYPTLAEAIATNRRFTGRPPVRDVGLLEAALLRPASSAFGHDAYPDLWSKAAAMLHSIIGNHPFLDGNKRTGVALALAFLDRNGEDVSHVDQQAVIELAVGLAKGTAEVADITVALRRAVRGPAPG